MGFRSQIVLLFALLLSTAALSQVRPDQFTEQTAPDSSNFEVYSQKDGINRRANLYNLKKYFVPGYSTTALTDDLSTGDTIATNFLSFVTDLNGDVFYVDGSGIVFQLSSVSVTAVSDTSRFVVYAPSHGLTDTISTYGYVPVQGDYTRANSTSLDSTHFAYAVDAPTTDSLELKFSGTLTVAGHGLTVGRTYFLQDSGPDATTPGTVRAPTVFALDANTLVLTEVGADQDQVISRQAVPSPVFTFWGGDPQNPSDSIMQIVVDSVFAPAGLAKPSTIFFMSYSSQSKNPTYQDDTPTDSPLNPSHSWFYDGNVVTRMNHLLTSVDLQATSAGLFTLDTVQLIGGVPTDSTVANWLDSNYVNNGLRLPNGAILYWQGNGTPQSPDYSWMVIDDITNTTETNGYKRILKRVDSPVVLDGNGIISALPAGDVNITAQSGADFNISRLNGAYWEFYTSSGTTDFGAMNLTPNGFYYQGSTFEGDNATVVWGEHNNNQGAKYQMQLTGHTSAGSQFFDSKVDRNLGYNYWNYAVAPTLGDTLGNHIFLGDRYDGVQRFAISKGKFINWDTMYTYFEIPLDDTTSNISVYNGSYELPNTIPSSTSGDTSVIAWAGDGAGGATPLFLDYGGGGSSVVNHDTSAYFHRRLTFGTGYTLPSAVLDTADIISIYAGAQTGTSITITLPTLSDTTYDGKIIYVMGSGTENGDIMRITSPDSTDILVQGCGAGSVTGPDTITTSYRVLYQYIISNGRYYRTCQRPNVNSITSVPDTTNIDAHQGDMFVNSTADTLGLYSGTGWVLFYGGGGGAQTQTITQSSHGFSVGDPVVYSSGAWVAANTTVDSLLHDGIVADSTGVNTFKLQQYGLLTWPGHGLKTESYYYLQDNGTPGLSADNDGDDYDYNDLLYFVLDANTVLVTEQRAGVTNNITKFYDYDTSTVSPIAIDWRGLGGRFVEVNLNNFTQGDFIDLTFSNPVNGGYYKTHFTNSDSVNIIWPTTVYWEDGVAADTMGVDADKVFSIFYNGDDSRYIIEFPGSANNTNRGAYFEPSAFFVRDSTVLDSIPGLVFHININEETGYINNDAIDSLQDFSSFSHWLIQDTASLQPTYKENIINGYPAVLFDGTEYMYRDSLGELASGNDWTIFIVGRPTLDNAINPILLNQSDDGASNPRLHMFFNTEAANKFAGNIKTDNGAFVYNYLADLSTASFVTTSFVNDFTASGGTAEIFLNGTSQESQAWTFTSTSYTNDIFKIGQQRLSNLADFFTGYIAEILIYNTNLSSTDRGYVEEYLANKYGHY